MLSFGDVPQNYNQTSASAPLQGILQQIGQKRPMADGGTSPMAMPSGMPQTGMQQNQSAGVNPLAGIQAISKLLGYSPDTTFGYDMNPSGPQQGPTMTGAPVQTPSMNLSNAVNNQSILAMISSMFL